jgi:hypothetical protein
MHILKEIQRFINIKSALNSIVPRINSIVKIKFLLGLEANDMLTQIKAYNE